MTKKSQIFRTAVMLPLFLSFITISFAANSGTRPSLSEQNNGNEQRGKTVPNVVVIKLKNGNRLGKAGVATGIVSLDRLLQTYSVYKLEPVLKTRLNKKPLPDISTIYYAYYNGKESPQTVARTIRQNSQVEYAEPLYIHHITEIPNDPDINQQSFHSIINTPQAWDIVKGEQGSAVIAIVDGGTDINHPDLAANIWVNPGEIPGNSQDDDNNGYVDDVHGWNFANDSNNPTGLPGTPLNADHGTLTAGLAGAVANNGIGVAGTSWNARIMPINTSSASRDTVIAFGYDGVVYAATNGANVINLSWGDQHPPSEFEKDIIRFVTEMGAVIVAAAGNEDSAVPSYPAGYSEVLSVAATTTNDQRAFFSNYGTTVDLTAPGVGIFSTINNGGYGAASGTSFSSPIVAGIVGLVQTQNPNWIGMQTSEQVRITADNIDELNAAYAGLLGHGRVNAFKAVTLTDLPSLQITNVSFIDEGGDGIIEPGENVQLLIDFINYLQPVDNVNVTLTTSDFYVRIINNTSTLPVIQTFDHGTISSPFSFSVESDAPRSHKVNFEVELSANNTYQDRDQFSLTILPSFSNIVVNNISTSITNVGRIGFADTDNQDEGIGFTFKGSNQLLFEGAIIAGNSASQISNSARSTRSGDNILYDEDFVPTENGAIRTKSPGQFTDLETKSIFRDDDANNPMGILVKQYSYSSNLNPYNNFIILRYLIINDGDQFLDNFHFGIFFDWDMDASTVLSNVADYDAQNRIGYAYDTSPDGPDTYVGMKILNSNNVWYRAIYNDNQQPQNTSWGLYDGFTDSEKWQAISTINHTKAGPGDISHSMGAGPFQIVAGDSIEIGFTLLAGSDLNSLIVTADSALVLWNKISDVVPTPPPDEFALDQNHPNPFNPEKNPTIFQYKLPNDAYVELVIYNLLGQKIRTLVQQRQIAKDYTFIWDGTDDTGIRVASGVYIYRFKAGEFIQKKKIVLVR